MSLVKISTADLQRELAVRAKGAEKLMRKREKIAAQLAELENELAALGVGTGKVASSVSPASSAAPAKRTRAKNAMSLPDAIADAMEVRAVVSPKEAAEIVLSNGFQTTSKNFGMMVATALAKDNRFKRVGRGQYERVA